LIVGAEAAILNECLNNRLNGVVYLTPANPKYPSPEGAAAILEKISIVYEIPVTFPTPPEPPKPKVTQTQFIIVDNKTDVQVETNIQTELTAITPPVLIPVEPYVEKNVEELGFVYISEVMPSFPGGEEEMYKFLSKHMKYPSMALENNISDTVFISFIVEPDGTLSHKTLLKGIGGGCDEEAIRVVKLMPNWIPGTQKGEPVRIQFNMPIKFKLSK